MTVFGFSKKPLTVIDSSVQQSKISVRSIFRTWASGTNIRMDLCLSLKPKHSLSSTCVRSKKMKKNQTRPLHRKTHVCCVCMTETTIDVASSMFVSVCFSFHSVKCLSHSEWNVCLCMYVLVGTCPFIIPHCVYKQCVQCVRTRETERHIDNSVEYEPLSSEYSCLTLSSMCSN